MRILIVATNQLTYPYAVAPLGAANVTSALRRFGHRADLLDLCFETDVESALDRALEQFEPEIVGISVRNLDDCSFHTQETYYDAVRHMVGHIRRRSDASIIAGGSALAVGGAALLDQIGVELGIVGEGEAAAPALVQAIADGGRDLDSLPGLVRLGAAGLAETVPQRHDLALDHAAVNDVSCIDFDPYFRRGGFVGIQTRRGCPMRCLYCTYPMIEGRRSRLRPPRLVVDDMERIVAETGRRDFFFSDSVFNVPVGQARHICEELLRRDLGVRWMAYCNPLHLDRSLAQLFRRAGCVGLELGLDAVTDKMIEGLRKGFAPADVERASAALREAEIPFAHCLIFGGPGETWADIEEARCFLDGTAPANAVFVALGLRIYSGTPLRELAVAEGIIEADDPLLRPTYYLSLELGPDASARLDRFVADTMTWITPTDWEERMVKLVYDRNNRLRNIPPWKDLAEYGQRRPKRS